MEEIKFQSKWLERCVRDYLEIGDAPITKEALSTIKYLYVATTHDYELGFGKDSLPKPFGFSDAGDEWECCCISNTGRFKTLEEFVEVKTWWDIKQLYLIDEIVKQEEEYGDYTIEFDKKAMKEFEENIATYYTEESDFEGLEENEETCEWGIVVPEDFAYFSNLEAVRLMSCQIEIHNLKFLESLSNLKVLEIGEVRLHNLEGLEKLIGLDKLCIWSN